MLRIDWMFSFCGIILCIFCYLIEHFALRFDDLSVSRTSV